MFDWLLERFYQFLIYEKKSIKKIEEFPFESFDFNQKEFLQKLYFSNLKFENSLSLIDAYYETEILFDVNLISFYEY